MPVSHDYCCNNFRTQLCYSVIRLYRHPSFTAFPLQDRWAGREPLLGGFRRKEGCPLDKLPEVTYTNRPPFTLTFTPNNSPIPQLHVFVVWEDTRVPRENPHRTEKQQSASVKFLLWGNSPNCWTIVPLHIRIPLFVKGWHRSPTNTCEHDAVYLECGPL